MKVLCSKGSFKEQCKSFFVCFFVHSDWVAHIVGKQVWQENKFSYMLLESLVFITVGACSRRSWKKNQNTVWIWSERASSAALRKMDEEKGNVQINTDNMRVCVRGVKCQGKSEGRGEWLLSRPTKTSREISLSLPVTKIPFSNEQLWLLKTTCFWKPLYLSQSKPRPTLLVTFTAWILASL